MVSGGEGHPKIFELKRRGPSQKLRGEGGSCRYMHWFEGTLKGKQGVMQNFSEIIKKPPPLLPHPPIKMNGPYEAHLKM